MRKIDILLCLPEGMGQVFTPRSISPAIRAGDAPRKPTAKSRFSLRAWASRNHRIVRRIRS